MGISQQIGASSLIKAGVVDNTANRPASPYEGQVIFQKDTDQLLVWNGTTWVIPNSPAQNPSGLELVSTTEIGGTAVGSGAVNNCFTNLYNNYQIHFNNTTGTTAAVLIMYGRTSGANTTNGWYGNTFYVGNGSGGALTNAPFSDQSGIELGSVQNGVNTIKAEIMQPQTASYTNVYTNSIDSNYWRIGTSTHRANSQFDGFGWALTGGTFTGGTITVYGYRK